MGLQERVDGECVGQRKKKKRGNSMDQDMQEQCCSWTNEGSCFVCCLPRTKNRSQQDEKGSKAMAPEALGIAALSPHDADTDRVGVVKGSVAHAAGGGGDCGERESQEDNNQIQQCKEKRRAQGALAHSDDTQVDSGSCGCCCYCCCGCRNEA